MEQKKAQNGFTRKSTMAITELAWRLVEKKIDYSINGTGSWKWKINGKNNLIPFTGNLSRTNAVLNVNGKTIKL